MLAPAQRSPGSACHLRAGVVAGLLAVAVALDAPDARSQNAGNQAAAEALFDQGKAAMAAKNYAEACPKFYESNRLDQGIGTSLWLAECYEMNGQTASAWAEFRSAASLAVKSSDPREKVARDRALGLEAKLARLVLIVPTAARLPGLKVARDGGEVATAIWGTSVPVDPGRHTVVVSAPDHRSQTLSITILPGPGEQAVIVPVLAEGGPPVVAAAPRHEDPSGHFFADLPAQRYVALGAGAVGVVTLVLGSYFGLHAKSQLDDSNSSGHCGANNLCDATGVADRSAAQSSATASTILFVVTGVALAGGGAAWIFTPSAKPKAAPSAAPPAEPPTEARVIPWLDPRGGGVVVGTNF